MILIEVWSSKGRPSTFQNILTLRNSFCFVWGQTSTFNFGRIPKVVGYEIDTI